MNCMILLFLIVVLLAADILKINNVPDHLKNLVFKHGLNLIYPNLQTLLNRTHLYKSKPTHKGKPRKSRGKTEIVEYESSAPPGLKEAVEKR